MKNEINYFEARGIESAFYAESRLPYYYKEILSRLDSGARILDFGCGFGQNLYNIKHNRFEWGGGIAQ